MTEVEERDFFKAMNKLKRKRVYEERPACPDSFDVGYTERWVREGMIGKGEFGKVFLARPAKPTSNFPSTMAVKSAHFSESTELAKESRLLKKFRDCPYILNTYGSDVTVDTKGEKMFNVFLEYAELGTIDDCIQKLKGFRLLEQQVRKYTESVLKGLKYIHDKGFVHCDIKPANIFLARNIPDTELCLASRFEFGTKFMAKIGDFGLTKRAAKDNVMKRSGIIQGTGMYMSPEVTHDNIQEPPSDIWALGCCVLQMLTGKEEWEVSTELKDEWGDPIEIPIIPEELNDEAKDFLGKCFRMNPLERYTAEMLLKHPFVCNSTYVCQYGKPPLQDMWFQTQCAKNQLLFL